MNCTKDEEPKDKLEGTDILGAWTLTFYSTFGVEQSFEEGDGVVFSVDDYKGKLVFINDSDSTFYDFEINKSTETITVFTIMGNEYFEYSLSQGELELSQNSPSDIVLNYTR